MYLLHQWIKQESVDVLIGNTYGKYIARDEDIPFVRYGFPIMDRVGIDLPRLATRVRCVCWRRFSESSWTARIATLWKSALNW